MIDIFLAAIAAVAPPAITTVPCENECGPVEPNNAVVDLHQEHALAIYRPYFECYWATLSEQPGFGSHVAAQSQAALVAARNECTSMRINGDEALDRFLASTGSYGDSTEIAKIRDRFRSQAGTVFNYMTASATGKRAEYLATMQSALGLSEK